MTPKTLKLDNLNFKLTYSPFKGTLRMALGEILPSTEKPLYYTGG